MHAATWHEVVLLSCRSAHPAAAWSSSGTPKVPVQPGEVLLPVWGWAGCPAPEHHLSTAVL